MCGAGSLARMFISRALHCALRDEDALLLFGGMSVAKGQKGVVIHGVRRSRRGENGHLQIIELSATLSDSDGKRLSGGRRRDLCEMFHFRFALCAA